MNCIGSSVSFESLSSGEIKEIIAENYTVNDDFHNTHINLLALPLCAKKVARLIKEIIPEWIEAGQSNTKHMITLKLSPTQSRIHKYALNAGFLPHHANSTETLMTLCLHKHTEKQISLYLSFQRQIFERNGLFL